MEKKLLVNVTAALFSLFALLSFVGNANASITFSFTESGGQVFMQSSGTLNTANLVSMADAWWAGVGIEDNDVPESDIMGDTTMGDLDLFFGFHDGTDLSAWVGGLFTQSYFSWESTGTTQFATWIWDEQRTPGISIASEDLVGDLWTPDVSWVTDGTLAGLGLTPGIYTVLDGVTSEYITIQVGKPVPVPAAVWLFGSGLAGLFGFSRHKRAMAS